MATDPNHTPPAGHPADPEPSAPLPPAVLDDPGTAFDGATTFSDEEVA